MTPLLTLVVYGRVALRSPVYDFCLCYARRNAHRSRSADYKYINLKLLFSKRRTIILFLKRLCQVNSLDPFWVKATVSWFSVETIRCQRSREGVDPITPAEPLQGKAVNWTGARISALGDLLVVPCIWFAFTATHLVSVGYLYTLRTRLARARSHNKTGERFTSLGLTNRYSPPCLYPAGRVTHPRAHPPGEIGNRS